MTVLWEGLEDVPLPIMAHCGAISEQVFSWLLFCLFFCPLNIIGISILGDGHSIYLVPWPMWLTVSWREG